MNSYFIGWDVGGWNCDNNSNGRDAIVILDETLRIVGRAWRRNLRECIVAAPTTVDWLQALFAKCKAEYPAGNMNVTMAIDTPLGFPSVFETLLARQGHVEPDKTSGLNRYLFRYTERHLFEQGLKPLSTVKDMTGSQATKGMHVLLKYAPNIESCGVWSDGRGFRAIETYPAACRHAPEVLTRLKDCSPLGHDDLDDARVCAVIAYLFNARHETLEGPPSTVPRNEGWIWIPRGGN